MRWPVCVPRAIGYAVLLSMPLVALACTQPPPPSPTATAKPVATAVPAAATPTPQPIKPAPSAPAAAKPASTVTVRAGHLAVPSDVYTYIALEKGYFKDEGIVVELTLFDTAAKMIAPMAADQLDVGGGSPSAGLFNAIARDVPIKIVAERNSVTPNDLSVGLVVRKDLLDKGALKDYADLRGKNVALNAKGTSNEIGVEKALKKGGLTFSDINAIEMPFPQMNVAFGNNAIDAGQLIEPFVTLGQERGFSALWKPGYDYQPLAQVAVLMYAPSFIKDKPDVAKRYMVAYVKGIRDYHDAFFKNKNKSEVIGVLTKYTSTKDPNMFLKMNMHGVDPNGYVNLKSLMEDQDWYASKGYVKDKVTEGVLVDNQFVDYAVQRLGKYQ